MSGKKVVVVFDAAGTLGVSVARALAECQEFVVRCLARDLQSKQAQSLRSENVDLVNCDISDRDSLHQCLRGVYACFVSTTMDFDDPGCMEAEIAQGCLIADACKSEDVHHVIYSSQLHTRNICSILARHFVAKAEVEGYMRDIGLPLTSLIIPVCYEDLFDLFKPRTQDGKNFDIEIPMGKTPLDMICVKDMGLVVVSALRQRDAYLYKTLSVCGDKLTVKEVAQILTKHLRPRIFKDKQLTAQEFHEKRSRDLKGSADWANVFQFFQRVDQRYNMSVTKQMNPNLCSFEDWVRENVSELTSVLQ